MHRKLFSLRKERVFIAKENVFCISSRNKINIGRVKNIFEWLLSKGGGVFTPSGALDRSSLWQGLLTVGHRTGGLPHGGFCPITLLSTLLQIPFADYQLLSYDVLNTVLANTTWCTLLTHMVHYNSQHTVHVFNYFRQWKIETILWSSPNYNWLYDIKKYKMEGA